MPGVAFNCDGNHPDEFSEDGKLVLAVAVSKVLERQPCVSGIISGWRGPELSGTWS